MPDDHYHEGRPVIRDGREHIIALCPFGHLLHTMPKREWAGSWLEGVASDPNWRMKCYGAMPTSSKAIYQWVIVRTNCETYVAWAATKAEAMEQFKAAGYSDACGVPNGRT